LDLTDEAFSSFADVSAIWERLASQWQLVTAGLSLNMGITLSDEKGFLDK
jgi:hypothetical protein